jgi:hypothetical protein
MVWSSFLFHFSSLVRLLFLLVLVFLLVGSWFMVLVHHSFGLVSLDSPRFQFVFDEKTFEDTFQFANCSRSCQMIGWHVVNRGRDVVYLICCKT